MTSLQFIYNVETNNGERIVTGALRGIRTGILQTYDLNSNETMKWGSWSDDFQIIIHQIIDGESIKNIDVKSIKVQTDSTKGYLIGLQFIYNVETNDGKKIVTGASRGIITGTLQTYDLNSNEKMKAITGSYGNNSREIVIKYLEFQSSERTKGYGKNDTADTLFTLPAGIPFGNSGTAVDSLGAYVVVEVPPILSSNITSNSSCFGLDLKID
ncbi:41374_t:CDS:2 [Gigaspora margarita]|uniref:41374_t:CDS:1 n=1 Tax=Gigaspora margarita TaxID=4874 RepID=A0ABN7USV7_GIGMA|nr:41374_t:CDS:2 [Gigaspora margarita]